MEGKFMKVSRILIVALVLLLSLSVSVCHSYPTEDEREDSQKFPGFFMTKDGYPSFAVDDNLHHQEQAPVDLPYAGRLFHNEGHLKSISDLQEEGVPDESIHQLLDSTKSTVAIEIIRSTTGYSKEENTYSPEEESFTMNQNDPIVLSEQVEPTESDNNEQRLVITEEPLQDKYEIATRHSEAIPSSANMTSINTTSLPETNNTGDTDEMNWENTVSMNATIAINDNSTTLLKTGKEEKVNEIFFDEKRFLEEENEFQEVYPNLPASQGQDELSAKSLNASIDEADGEEVENSYDNGNETHLEIEGGVDDNEIEEKRLMTPEIGESQEDSFYYTKNEKDIDSDEEAENLHPLENGYANENVVDLEDDIAKSDVTTEKSIANEPEVTEANEEIETTKSQSEESTIENETTTNGSEEGDSEEDAYTPEDNDETTESFTTVTEEIVDDETTESTSYEKAMQDIYTEGGGMLTASNERGDEKVEVVELETKSSTYHVSFFTVLFIFSIGLGLMMLCTRMPVYCYNLLRYFKGGEVKGVETFVRKWQKRGYSPVPMGDKYV